MNYTKNYQLNQWDATDRVLRTDFNSDNQKIDATLEALAESQSLAARFVKLKEVTTAQNVNGGSVEIDVSDIDFADWQYVHVDVYAKGFSGVQLRVNGKSTTCSYTQPGNGTCFGGTGYLVSIAANVNGLFADRITFHVGRSGQRNILCTCGNAAGHCSDVTFDSLTKLQFTSSAEISAGSRFILGGEA